MFDCNGLFGSTAGEAAFLAKQGMLAACVNIFKRSCAYFVVGCRKLFMGGRIWPSTIRRTENCAALLPVVRYNIFIAFEACLCRSGHTYSIALGSGMCTSGYISTSRAWAAIFNELGQAFH